MSNRDRILILYTDGSVRPGNPGFGGYGVYGYTLRESKRPSRVRHPDSNKYCFTSNGISVVRDEDPYETLDIVEHIGCIPGDKVTNNLAEIMAFITSLEIVKSMDDVKLIKVYTDSNYVVTGFNEHLDKWKSNGYKRVDGKDISHDDKWKYILQLKEELADIGVEVEATWVKGHDGDYGNEIADLYAVVGSNYSRIQNEDPSKEFREVCFSSVTSFNEYRDSLTVRDIIFYYRDLFFSSDSIDDRTFCFLSTSKDEMHLGRKDTASIFSVNLGYMPEVINKTKEIFRSIERPYLVNCCIKLNRLSENKHLMRLANIIGIDKLTVISEYRGKEQLFLVKDTSPYVTEYNKEFPYIMEAGRVFNSVLDISANPTEGPRKWVTDITDKIVSDGKLNFTTSDKLMDLGDRFEVPFKFMNKLVMSIGMDIPNRIAINRIVKDITGVKAILELKEGHNHVTLYTLIEMEDRVLCSTNIVGKFLVGLPR